MTAFLSIESNGSYIDLPEPTYKGYSNVREELTRADRNVDGFLIKEHVAWKQTIDVSWKGLTAAQKNLIISLTDPNSFGIRFFDMMTETYKYISASAGGVYRGTGMKITGYGTFNTTTNQFPYYDLSISLVER